MSRKRIGKCAARSHPFVDVVEDSLEQGESTRCLTDGATAPAAYRFEQRRQFLIEDQKLSDGTLARRGIDSPNQGSAPFA